jgi:GTP-binding protein HflX
MHENKEQIQNAILVSVDTGEFDTEISLAELTELAESAGANVLGTATQKRPAYNRTTLVGSGRLEEIKEFAEVSEADLLIFDHELTASQIRNISEKTGLDVIDRTMLILDIFASHAYTKEGRLQVELAQQRYRLPRLGGQGKSLSRLGGGIGTRGPGETKLEADKRHIRRRIEALEEQLHKVEKHREQLRARRKRDGITTVAIVGYTNVGKSTLLNTLTDAGVLAEDKLFATLDPTARALALPDGRNVMLVDTVGLVRRLPHQLIKAFHSTLEEAAFADLIMNVCDVSSSEVDEQIDVTESLMRELGVQDTPMLTVLNKADKLENAPDISVTRNRVLISAKTGSGIDELLTAIAKTLPKAQVNMELLIPYDKGGLVAEIRKDGKVLSEKFEGDGTRVTALVDCKVVGKVERYRI